MLQKSSDLHFQHLFLIRSQNMKKSEESVNTDTTEKNNRIYLFHTGGYMMMS